MTGKVKKPCFKKEKRLLKEAFSKMSILFTKNGFINESELKFLLQTKKKILHQLKLKFKIFNRNLENVTPGRLLKKYELLPIIRGMIIIQGVFYMLTHLSFHYSKTIIVTLTSFIIIQPDYGGRLYSKSQLITGIQSISVRVQKLGNIFWTFIENWV